MKVDAKLKIYDDNGDFSEGIVTIDLSYMPDEEGMISLIERAVATKYGASLLYGRDFSVTNFDALMGDMPMDAYIL